jgi:hypothetical protein
MKAVALARASSVLIAAVILFGCGGGTTGPSASGTGASSSGEVVFFKNGRSFGTYYIEGSCDGSDNRGMNVTSIGASGGKLIPRSGGACNADISFEINVYESSANSFIVDTRITSHRGGLKTISLPLDTPLNVFPDESTDWNLAGRRISEGCQRRGKVSDIPTPCNIPGVGQVGRVAELDPYTWGELIGPFGTIRREKLGGNCSRLLFYRHPGTNNIEIGFPRGGELRSGTRLTCKERISIL